MATQRKESVTLVRPREDIPWGFRFAHVSSAYPEVTRINPHSIASQHLRIGQLILEVNGVHVRGLTASDVASLVRRQGNRLNLLVQSGPDLRTHQVYSPTGYQQRSTHQPTQQSYRPSTSNYSPQSQHRAPPQTDMMQRSYYNPTHIQPVYASAAYSAPSPAPTPNYSSSQPLTNFGTYYPPPQDSNASNTVRIRNAGAPHRDMPSRASAVYQHPQSNSTLMKVYPTSANSTSREPKFFNERPFYVTEKDGGQQSRLQQLLQNDMEAQRTGIIEAPIRPSAHAAQQHHQPPQQRGPPPQVRSVSSISLTNEGPRHHSSTFPRRGGAGPHKKNQSTTQKAPSRRWDQEMETTAKVQNWFQQSAPPSATSVSVAGGQPAAEEEPYVHVPVRSRVGNFEALTGQNRPETKVGAAATMPRCATAPGTRSTTNNGFHKPSAPVAHVNATQAEEVLHIDPRTRGEFGEVTENYTDF